MDLLLVSNENKSHYVYIKDFDRFMFHKTKNKNIFEKFSEEKLPDKKCIYNSVKGETTSDNGKKLDGHISDKNYLTCNKICNKFNMKNIDDCHEKRCIVIS